MSCEQKQTNKQTKKQMENESGKEVLWSCCWYWDK